jgi:hypothetical protein
VAGRTRSTEKSNDLSGNRTCNLPACSTVPQLTTLPHDPNSNDKRIILPYHKSSNRKLSNRSVARILCDNIISSHVWPPRSLDMSPPNFHLQELQKMCIKQSSNITRNEKVSSKVEVIFNMSYNHRL